MLDSHGNDGAEELKDVVFVNGLGLLPVLALDNFEFGSRCHRLGVVQLACVPQSPRFQ
jgi:hypothetical protein